MTGKTNIKLSLVVFGDHFDPETLDDIMDVSNTSWHKKDDVIPHRPKNKWKETSWNYTIDNIESLFLTDLTDFFVRTMDKKVDVLLGFMEHYHLDAKVFITFEIFNDEKPALFFNSDFIEMLTKLRAEVDIDF